MLPSSTQLALPLNHSKPSTSIVALNGFRRRFSEPRPHVGGPPDPLLQAAAARISDHRRVEADAGHDCEALAVEAADVEPAATPVQPDRNRLLDLLRDPEVRREEVRRAGGHDREGGGRSGEDVDAPLHQSRRLPRRKRDRPPPRARARPARGAFRLFGTSHQIGSPIPSASSMRRSSGRPPPIVFPACATTATLIGRSRRCSSAAPATRHAKTSATSAAMPTTTPPATSSGWCIPRYMRETATKTGNAAATIHTATWKPRRRDRRRDEQRQAAVDGDRGRRVARRVARVHRQALEPDDLRAVRVDDERRRAIGGRLDAEREHSEGADPPFPQNDAEESDRTRDDGEGDAPAEDRPDEGRIGARGRSVRGEPHVHVLVPPLEAGQLLQHPGDEEPAADREDDAGRQSGEHHHREDERWVDAQTARRRPPIGPQGHPGVRRAPALSHRAGAVRGG